MEKEYKIAVIGLGYVGLPLAVEFAKQYKVIGFDVDKERINQLNLGNDKTLEVSKENVLKALQNNKNTGLKPTFYDDELKECNIFIITVPTPIDQDKNPEISSLLKATKMVSKHVKPKGIVIYESTVYPGLTEEICAPLIEKESGLIFNKDFFCGYSPERINPGDKEHTITSIKKITSGSTIKTANIVDQLYASIIPAGTYMAKSIKIAEAAKVIENSQRDINIAFINELAKIFSKLNIDTHEVLEAASTKWNFLPFKPGLVGGHCIGVDPYYLAKKAQESDYSPEIILAGRKLNDSMGIFVANEVLELMSQKEINLKKAKVLILGITFKENCPDTRNSKVIDIYEHLKPKCFKVDVYDPNALKDEVKRTYNIELLNGIKEERYDVIIHAVSHKAFLKMDLKAIKAENTIIYDVKGTLNPKYVDKRL